MNPTPAQLAVFADLIGITPKTHRNLCSEPYKRFQYDDIVLCRELNLPPLDTPAGDDVYFARFFRWALSKLERAPYIAPAPEGYMAHAPAYSKSTDKRFAKSMTLALVRACQSARVPEIFAIFGEGE